MKDENQPLTLRDALRWDGLVAVAPLLVSTLERDHLLRWILWMAMHVVNAEACTLALTNLETGELEYAVVLGDKEQEVRQFRVRPGEGILGWVALNGKPVFAPDVTRHPLWKRDVAEKIGFPTTSIVCVPLEVKEQAIGALEVINKRGGGTFTDEDLGILTALASVAAVCVENSQLYKWLTERADDAEVGLLAANRELGRRKAELDAVISTMADGVLIADAQGRVGELNAAAADILSLRRAAVLGTNIRDEPLAAGPLAQVIGGLDGGLQGAAGRQWTLPLPDGRTVACRVSPFSDDAGRVLGFVLVMSDVTALAEMSRMKSEFVSYVAHELRTPLTCVQGYADILLPPTGDTLDEAQRLDYLGIIRSEADRVTRLINRLLNAARIEAGKALEMLPEAVDVGASAAHVIEIVRALGTKHDFKLEVATDTQPVLADADQVEEVLLNLVTNAVKYSPEAGLVRVRVEAAEDGVAVSVADKGVGMTPEQLSKLFGRFQRVLSGRSVPAGTGLGLFLSKGIVEAHGGRIWAESEPGEGSVFHFTLPAGPPPATPPSRSSAGSGRPD